MIQQVVAVRELSLVDARGNSLRKVILTVHSPALLKEHANDPRNVDWQVEFQVAGLLDTDSLWQGRAIQVDALGALIQAMQQLAAYVRSRKEYKDGRLFWLEAGDNCGLPFFEGLEYETGDT